MKIIFFIPSLESGGAEKVFSILCNQLASFGFSVEIILINKTGVYLSQLDKKIPIINLNKKRSIYGIVDYFKYIRKTKPDFVISALDNTNIIASIGKKFFYPKTKLIITCHSTISYEFSNNRGFKLFLVKKLMKYTFPFADKIVAVSKGVSTDLTNILNIPYNKLQIIYNPVYSNNILKLGALKNDFKWFKNKDHKIFISIGRLTDVKNFKLLIDSFKIVNKSIKSKLIIIGDGYLKTKLQEQIDKLNLDNDVSLVGYVENPYNWLSNSDVFVVTSKWEGLSCAMIEAMSFNLNIVSTNCYSGPLEILENGKWGFITKNNEKEDLAQCMIKASQLNLSLININRAKEFSINNSINGYLKLINDLSNE